jgi:hypothetical protein
MNWCATFLASYRAGYVDADDIHEYVARWHAAQLGDWAAQVDLYEYLGFTWEQYGRWVTTGQLPEV